MGDPLIFSAHCGHIMATFKFYPYNEEDFLKLCFTFSNLGDLEDQLYFLWVQLNYVLKVGYCYVKNLTLLYMITHI